MPKTINTRTGDYTERYANSVQARITLWDVLLLFGTLQPAEAAREEELSVANFSGVYLSPQQAKATLIVLSQHIAAYEEMFGQISLEATDISKIQLQ